MHRGLLNGLLRLISFTSVDDLIIKDIASKAFVEYAKLTPQEFAGELSKLEAGDKPQSKNKIVTEVSALANPELFRYRGQRGIKGTIKPTQEQIDEYNGLDQESKDNWEYTLVQSGKQITMKMR